MIYTLDDLINKFESWEEKQIELRDLLRNNPGNDDISNYVGEERVKSNELIMPVAGSLNNMYTRLQGEDKQKFETWVATKPYLAHIKLISLR